MRVSALGIHHGFRFARLEVQLRDGAPELRNWVSGLNNPKP